MCQQFLNNSSPFRETFTLLALPLSQASKLLDQAHDNIPVNAEIQSAAENWIPTFAGDGKVSSF